MTPESTLRFEWVTDAPRFLGLRDQWNAFSSSAVRTIFLTHDWLAAWLEEVEPNAILHVLTAWQGDKLAAAFPLAASPEHHNGRHWTTVGLGTLTPNHLDVIAEPEHIDEARAGFARLLVEARSDWDTLDLNKLPADSETVSVFTSTFSAAGLPTSCSVSAVCPCCDVPATYEEYFAARGKRLRRQIREAQKWLAQDTANHVLLTAETPTEALDAQAHLVRLHQARWIEKGYPGVFADPHIVRFHERMVKAALADGRLRMFTLRDGDETIAVSYNFRVGPVVQAYLSSFDARWASSRPGVVLRAYAMEQLILEGATQFDFLEGNEPYKASWCDSQRENLQLLVYNRTLGGRIAYIRHVANETWIRLARTLVPARWREQVVKALARANASGQSNDAD